MIAEIRGQILLDIRREEGALADYKKACGGVFRKEDSAIVGLLVRKIARLKMILDTDDRSRSR